MFENDSDLKKIVSRLNIDDKPSPTHRDKLRWQMLSVFNEAQKTSPHARTWQNTRRIIMKSKISKFAAAAVIIIAVITVINHFGGSINGATVAWADVIEQIRTFRPYSYTSTVQYEGKPDITRRMMILSQTRRREVYSDGYIQIFDLSQRPIRMLAIHPDKKLAVEKTIPDMGPGRNIDILRILSNLQDGTEEDLGLQEIDGRTAKVFHVPGENNDWTVWADIETRFPIRIELIHPKIGQKIIMSEFEFDVDFDESLFSMVPPEGYTIKKIVAPTEQDLIEGLRAVAVFLGGEFPPVFEMRPLQKVLREYIEQNNLSPSKEEMHSLGEKLSPATRYFARISSGRDYFKLSYTGGGVKLGDADTPVLWYRPQGSKTYHVIYGDLGVRDVSPEDLPK